MARSASLTDLITVALRATQGQSARELAAQVGESKSTVNSVLYSRRDLFFRNSDSRPRWWLQSLSVAAGESAPTTRAPGSADHLFDWQQEALGAWDAHEGRGVVEAVTGSGKTRVGLAAAHRHVDGSGKVAVIVPTTVLLEQWVARFEEWMPGARIGRLGGGGRDDLGSVDVLVAVVNSAAAHELGLPSEVEGLLIADECHRYAGARFRFALEEEFEYRLGLTATYARDDGGDEDVLDPYFRGIVFEYGYAEAVPQGVIAPFRVALVPVTFSGGERDAYEDLSEVMRRARKALIGLGAPEEPYQDFIQFVTRLTKHGTPHEGMVAGRYLKASRGRRDLLASAAAKYDALASLTDALRASSRSILFTETIESATNCAELLAAHGVSAESLHSQMPVADREQALARFADGSMKVVVAPKLLDEGVDVPEADLGVIFAASRQRRQMVQRLGRVLRRKHDGRAARFVILFVEGTTEDPDLDAHETFLEEILGVAEDIRRFRPARNQKALSTFLAP